MAANEFARALPRILVYEGGKVDDPNDPGGRTAYGVTQATFNAYLREEGEDAHDVFLITPVEISTIYKTMYWDKVCGDVLPMGVGFAVFDAAVNSGVGQAIKWLQASLGSAYTGEVDGQIGSKTLQAVEDYASPEDLIEGLCSRRLGTLKRLRTWPRYGKGWSARISNLQKIGCSWATPSSAPPVDVVDVTTAQGNAKATVTDNISTPPMSQIATHVSTAAASAGTIASQAAQQFTPVADTFGWIKYVCGGLTIAAVIAGILVKIATDANEAARKGTATAAVDPDADGTFTPVKVVEAPTTPPAPAAKAA